MNLAVLIMAQQGVAVPRVAYHGLDQCWAGYGRAHQELEGLSQAYLGSSQRSMAHQGWTGRPEAFKGCEGHTRTWHAVGSLG